MWAPARSKERPHDAAVMSTPPRLHRRLFWRVFLTGLALLLASGASFLIAGFLMQRRMQLVPPPDRFLAVLAADLERAGDDPGQLQAELDRLRVETGTLAAVESLDGRVLASTIEGPLPPTADVHEVPLRRAGIAVGRVRASVRLEPLGPPSRPLMFGQLAAMLAVVALLSLLLARAITRPIERLTQAAARLGAGDLTARTGLVRGDELGLLSTTFDGMANDIAKLIAAEKQLVADISHELRTPIASMRVALELADERAPDARAYLRDAQASVRELEDLVDTLLTTARMEMGAAPLECEPVSPQELLQESASRLKQRHPDRVVALQIAEGLPDVEVAPALIRRLLDNLLENAHKYSEPRTVIRLIAEEAGQGVALRVRDEGIGIEAQHIEKLFKPFFRTDASRARDTGGVGLGLHIAKRIADAHGAKMSVESSPGRGSMFSVELPVFNGARPT